jgi:alkylation response protein AidB-like acyl-CoA dehydrogenase
MAQPKDFGFGEEETMLRDSARKLLKDSADISALRGMLAKNHIEAYETSPQPVAFDEKLWRRMVDLGWTAVAVPESAGGMGMKMVAVSALAEEIGRACLPSPLTSTLLAALVLRESSGPGAAAALARVASGTATTLAVSGESGSWEWADTGVRAEGDPKTGYVLDGCAWFVQDARKAESFVCSAKIGGGMGLFVVAADAPGLEIAPDQIVDLTRDQARLIFRQVEVPAAAVLADGPEGLEVLNRALPGILTVVAADMTGAAEWQLQTTTEYAKVRKQFEHPLGFFQAVKHPLVDMMVDIDRARSLVYNAACAIDTEPEAALQFARMAKAAASDTAAFCSGRSVQLHGGIGFTWECDVQIWFKRQKHSQQLFGDASYQRAQIGNAL